MKERETRVNSELSLSRVEELQKTHLVEGDGTKEGFCYLLLITLLGCFPRSENDRGCLLGIQRNSRNFHIKKEKRREIQMYHSYL